jgi:hypothetical protein
MALHTGRLQSGQRRGLRTHAHTLLTRRGDLSVRLAPMLTAFGVTALTFMLVMYALERRDRRFILAFACGCVLSSVYGFLAGTWPFGVVEAI